MLITFSGLDGAGKTTLIRELRALLEANRREVVVLTMYDDVGVYASLRALRARLRAAGPGGPRSDREAALPRSGAERKVVMALRRPGIKRAVFFADLLVLLGLRAYHEGLRRRVLILDRYFYDSLADVADGERWRYVRFFLRLAPRPDVPIFVDVSPEVAFRRKGEYPVAHMERRRALYQRIFGWVREPVWLVNDDLGTTVKALEHEVLGRMRA